MSSFRPLVTADRGLRLTLSSLALTRIHSLLTRVHSRLLARPRRAVFESRNVGALVGTALGTPIFPIKSKIDGGHGSAYRGLSCAVFSSGGRSRLRAFFRLARGGKRPAHAGNARWYGAVGPRAADYFPMRARGARSFSTQAEGAPRSLRRKERAPLNMAVASPFRPLRGTCVGGCFDSCPITNRHNPLASPTPKAEATLSAGTVSRLQP
jgi:hypothetical protein